MLTAFINLPLFTRVFIVAAIGVAAARFINWAIYSWAFYSRSLGPWSKPSSGARSWADHLPVLGWYRLRGESAQHGRLYWLRPLLIELLFPLAITLYYHFYVSGQVLQAGPALRGLQPELHWQFIAHFVLFVLMSIATFIDFDEQSIPDYVTVPGTIIGLTGAAFAPAWLPYEVSFGVPEELHSALPQPWPLWLDGTAGLWIAVGIILVWGFALLDRRVILRRGFAKAVQYFFARMFRQPLLWKAIFAVTLLLVLGIAVCWSVQVKRWPYLMSSLLGLAFAGGVTWGVRLSASYGLGMEALGFGDVTLMAMIGTYVGWQPSLIIFFIAPLVAILFVLIRWIVTGDAATPYGPYLCAAAVLLLVFWDSMWTKWAAPLFSLGVWIVWIVVACVALMGVMLWTWRLIKQVLGIGAA